MDVVTSVTNSVYFMVFNIFSFRSVEFIILLNRNARFSRASVLMFTNVLRTGECGASKLLVVGSININVEPVFCVVC